MMDENAVIDINAAYRYAIALTHNPDEASDLVQEGIARLLEKKGNNFARAMLYKTIRNIFIDQHRKNRLMIVESYSEDIADQSVDVSSVVNFSREEIQFALGTLRTEEREALFLHALDGISAREIAKITGHPRNTVLSLIHRAKIKLQRVLHTQSQGEVSL